MAPPSAPDGRVPCGLFGWGHRGFRNDFRLLHEGDSTPFPAEKQNPSSPRVPPKRSRTRHPRLGGEEEGHRQSAKIWQHSSTDGVGQGQAGGFIPLAFPARGGVFFAVFRDSGSPLPASAWLGAPNQTARPASPRCPRRTWWRSGRAALHGGQNDTSIEPCGAISRGSAKEPAHGVRPPLTLARQRHAGGRAHIPVRLCRRPQSAIPPAGNLRRQPMPRKRRRPAEPETGGKPVFRPSEPRLKTPASFPHAARLRPVCALP